jgi:hypothetical protein
LRHLFEHEMHALPHGQPVRHCGPLRVDGPDRVAGNTTGLSTRQVSVHAMQVSPHLHPFEHPAAVGAGNTSALGVVSVIGGAGAAASSVSRDVSVDGSPRSIHGLLGGSAGLALRSRSA